MNPYKEGTNLYKVFNILSDLQWHCSVCELPGSQPAKLIQLIRNQGYDFDNDGGVNWEKRILCSNCGKRTSHRRLTSIEVLDNPITRLNISNSLRSRVIALYFNQDSILGYSPTGRSIEVDHRVPQIRWKENEEELLDDCSDEDIRNKYMLLVREHNLLKSRNCERCVATNTRQPFIDIDYFYEGDSNYDDTIGCKGCGWYNPEEWKKHINNVLNIDL